ncbi:MAG: sigma-54-dependent Fis family transcriptional regulator [Proteobacteria bacterium]|nr:sigma-54-dependent Fis family transcriptional regulator [Pseudomonadota bacterium]
MNTKVLIVEDDLALQEALKITLKNAKFLVDCAHNAELALNKIHENEYDLILSDVNLGKMSGLDLLHQLKFQGCNTPVILMTAYGKIADAVNAIQQGACDYVTKPFDANELINKIHNHARKEILLANIIHEDKETKRLVELALQVASTEASVLISGESGTGKEIFAKLIHDNSARKDAPFVAINCAAIPENMLESILFGYEKGAFTGAYQSTAGKLEQANLGTILLDEISEMSLSLQAKLLRVIQEREVEKLGGKKTIKLDIRIIATTNRLLSKEVEKGNFRSDLYFRLNVFPLQLSALRERKGDIIPLSYYFIKKYAPQGQSYTLSDSAKTKLLSYEWPGNIRELQNIIQRALILSKNNVIEPISVIFEHAPLSTADESLFKNDLSNQLTETENELIIKVLQKHQGNRNLTADELGISPRTLRYKLSRMKKMGIEIP